MDYMEGNDSYHPNMRSTVPSTYLWVSIPLVCHLDMSCVQAFRQHNMHTHKKAVGKKIHNQKVKEYFITDGRLESEKKKNLHRALALGP